MKKKIVVMTFGTFDHLHPGHRFYLQEAKKQGNYLITVVARDKTVEDIKWKKVREPESIRIKNLIDAQLCDEVVLGSLTDHYTIILEKKPDVLCFGYDQRSFNDKRLEEYLATHHLHPRIVILPPFEPEKWKSSKL